MQHIHFATRACDRGERNRQWCAATQSPNVMLEDDREASIRGGDVGGVRICRVAAGRHRILGEGGTGTNRAAPLIKVILQEEGQCRVEQGGRSLLLGPGQWCAYDKAQPFRIIAEGFCRQTALMLPADALGEWDDTGRRLMLCHSHLNGVGSILHASTTAAVAQIGAIGDADAATIGRLLVDLLRLALPSPAEPALPSAREARRHEVIAHIERHLDDPALDVDSVAAALGCSKRTLHKLFADQERSVGRMILDRRLERCREELRDPALSGRSITDIALSWGFSDSQHFSRSFRSRFGAPPRAFRERCGPGWSVAGR